MPPLMMVRVIGMVFFGTHDVDIVLDDDVDKE